MRADAHLTPGHAGDRLPQYPFLGPVPEKLEAQPSLWHSCPHPCFLTGRERSCFITAALSRLINIVIILRQRIFLHQMYTLSAVILQLQRWT